MAIVLRNAPNHCTSRSHAWTEGAAIAPFVKSCNPLLVLEGEKRRGVFAVLESPSLSRFSAWPTRHRTDRTAGQHGSSFDGRGEFEWVVLILILPPLGGAWKKCIPLTVDWRAPPAWAPGKP